jgi:hypothetical protein
MLMHYCAVHFTMNCTPYSEMKVNVDPMFLFYHITRSGTLIFLE